MTIEENNRLSDLLKFEIDKNYCREIVTVASGQNLKLGEIVGMKTANDQVKSVYLITGVQNEVLDGSEIAIGVVLEDIDATSGIQKALMVARSAIVADSCVIFPTGATDAQKKKITKDLESRGILIKKAV
jgi:cyclophilin family peptidyl-prolyl cis-trans isomerase